jgi:hypothetical protein
VVDLPDAVAETDSEQTQVEPVNELRAEILRPGTRIGQESGASNSTAKESISSLSAVKKNLLVLPVKSWTLMR